jgi:hypothetical protein
LLKDMQSRAPRRTQGADQSGAVRVVLGPDGLPVSITVVADWQQRTGTRAFGSAVVDAFTVAARQRVAVWTQTLEREGWHQRVEQLRREVAAVRDDPAETGADIPAGVGAIPAAFARKVAAAGKHRRHTAQPLGSLTEDALKTFDVTQRLAETPAAQRNPLGTGHSAYSKLSVTLSASALVACDADQNWLNGLPPEAVNRALRQALSAARARLAEQHRSAQAAAKQNSSELHRVFDEAMTLLGDPRLLSESR